MNMIDHTDELANLLNVPTDALVENIGGYWHRVGLPSDHSASNRAWFESGNPTQVMIGVGDTDICVAHPRILGGLPNATFLEPAKIVSIHNRYDTQNGATLREAVRKAERRRRSSFRYCHYCRTLTPPEYLFATSTCQGCASRFLEVDF